MDTGFVASPEKTEAPYITNVKPFQRCWAKGSRNKWLESHVPPYASARNRSPLHGAEYAASVVREFVAKFSWYLRMEIEPTPGNLCLESSLPQDVLQLKQAALERLDAAIPKWLAHRYNKADPITKMSKKQISKNPVASILAKVADINVEELQRARTPQQLWAKENKDTINEEFVPWFASSGLDAKKQRAKARQDFVDKLFDKLDKNERLRWKKAATQERERLAKIKEEGREPTRRLEPEELQEALDGLAGVLQPLLEGLHEVLGGNIHFFFAGPEPQKGGQVNVISLHVGKDKSAVPQPFHSAGGERGLQRRRYAEAAIGEFAMESFSLEEQEQCSLPGVSMSRTAPSFMRQPMPWNTIGNQLLTVIPSSRQPLEAPIASSPPSFPETTPPTPNVNVSDSATSTGKRKRPTKVQGTRKKSGRGRSRRGEGDSDTDDNGDDGAAEKNTTEANNSPKTPKTRSKTVLDDITNTTTTLASPATATTANFLSNIDPALFSPSSTDIPTSGPMDAPYGPNFTPPSSVALPSSAVSPSSIPPSPISTSAGLRSDMSTKLKDAPKWLTNATGVPWCQGLGLGPAFEQLVHAWIDLEAAHNFGKKKELPHPKSRPAGVQYWVQCGRARYPPIAPLASNIRKTANDFWAWWALIQPQWRGVDSTMAPFREQHRPSNAGSQDWGRLQTCGQTGHFSTIAGLAFWGQACIAAPESVLALGEWSAAVEDVEWVLRAMTEAAKIS